MELNKIYQGNALDVLRTFGDESVDCVITSPPYYATRVYACEPVIWDAKNGCEHEWKMNIKTLKHKKGETNPGIESWFKDKGASEDEGNYFCSKCGAWKGSLGLEPTPELYIDHLLQIFMEVRRVLKKTGTCFIVLGDTYGGSGCGTNDYRTEKSKSIQGIGKNANLYKTCGIAQKSKYKKSLLMIPYRFAWKMIENGWTLRNILVWHKPNCIPCSATDRFTVDFEPVFFFTKSKKYYFEMQYEPYQNSTLERTKHNFNSAKYSNKNISRTTESQRKWAEKIKNNPQQGRHRRCVWTISTKSYGGNHFAVYPDTLVEPMVLAGCPPGGLVLDTFAGTGTTLLVAKRNNRNYIGIELSPDYISQAEQRLKETVCQLNL